MMLFYGVKRGFVQRIVKLQDEVKIGTPKQRIVSLL